MTMGVFDFKAIKRRLDCQEQKAEHEAQNPPPPAWYSKPVVSLAHPEWPYTGTPHEWPKLKI